MGKEDDRRVSVGFVQSATPYAALNTACASPCEGMRKGVNKLAQQLLWKTERAVGALTVPLAISRPVSNARCEGCQRVDCQTLRKALESKSSRGGELTVLIYSL